MKRKLLASLLGLAASFAVTTAQAQGRILLDNYNTYGPYVTYGGGGSQIPGTTAGNSIVNGIPATATWTIGFYWALGDHTGTAGNDGSGWGEIGSWANGLTLGTGTGSSTGLVAPGAFLAGAEFSVPGYTSGSVTLALFAYAGGADYASAQWRGHSTAFLITPATGSSFGTAVGSAMPTFSVYAVPEPSTFALAGLGAAALLIFRRRKE